jgi:hypothetical protein
VTVEERQPGDPAGVNIALPGRQKKTGHFPVLSAVRHVQTSVLHVASLMVRMFYSLSRIECKFSITFL